METSRVGKVTAVCVRQADTTPEVLVFDHPLDDGGFNIQLPAGTIELLEAPEVAALRELAEETGVRGRLNALVGVRDEEWEREARRRWVFLVDAPEGLLDEWPYSCDCGAAIRCHWLSFESAEILEPQQPWLEMAKNHFYSRPDQGV